MGFRCRLYFGGFERERGYCWLESFGTAKLVGGFFLLDFEDTEEAIEF